MNDVNSETEEGPFVLASWNGIPDNNSGRREVHFVTERTKWSPRGEVELFGIVEAKAKRFPTREAALEFQSAAVNEGIRHTDVKVYRLATVHADTGGHPRGIR